MHLAWSSPDCTQLTPKPVRVRVHTVAATGCPGQPSLFQGNSASFDGGDVAVMMASMLISGAQFRGSSAAFGGAISAVQSSLILSGTTISNCTAQQLAGGLHVRDAAAILENTTFSYNRAGEYGGGLALFGNASLHLMGVSCFQHNRAKSCGGGILIESAKLTSTNGNGSIAVRLLDASDNTATYAADTCVAAKKVAVVGTDANLDAFVTSLDSEGGLLRVTLNVSGTQGLPADDPIQLTIFNSKGKAISTQRLDGKVENGLRQVAIKLRQPPGE